MLITGDELASVLLGLNQYKNGKGSDKEAYLSFYDAGPAKIDRKTSTPPSIHILRAFVAITGGIQPGVARRLFGAEEFDSGLGARFLFAAPPEVTRKWTDTTISKTASDSLGAVYHKLLGLKGQTVDGDVLPTHVPLSPAAKAAFAEFYNAVRLERAEDDNGRVKAMLAKIIGGAARLALILHEIAIAAEEPGVMPGIIDEKSMLAGITLARWFANEARRIYAMFGEATEEKQNRELVELIQRRGGQISVRDLRQCRRKYRDDPKQAQADLQGLADAGIGEWRTTTQNPNGGRQSCVFVLHDPVNETPDSEGVFCTDDNETLTGDSANEGIVDVVTVDTFTIESNVSQAKQGKNIKVA